MELTFGSFCVARKGGLRGLVLELVEDLTVGDVAHLVVLVDDHTLPVADAFLIIRHERTAGVVAAADIAVYALPAFVTLALLAFPRQPIVPVRQ